MSSPTPSGGTWRFLVDENATRLLAPRLLTAGYVADDVRDVGLAARPDHEVWAFAQAHDETIITKDKDFADIRAYPTPHAGIVIADIPDTISISTFVQLILDGLAPLAGQSLVNTVVTISPGRVRVHR
jgi:predicted nuclease of predicted toxin-antitoxin system